MVPRLDIYNEKRKLFCWRKNNQFQAGNNKKNAPPLSLLKNNRFPCNPQLLLFASRDNVIFLLSRLGYKMHHQSQAVCLFIYQDAVIRRFIMCCKLHDIFEWLMIWYYQVCFLLLPRCTCFFFNRIISVIFSSSIFHVDVRKADNLFE